MALTKITANIIEDGAISTASLANTSITADKLHTTLDLTGKTITVATATAGDNDTTVASTAFVSTAIANLADSAPETLNTLNELAAALGDDANFSTTVTNSIALKAPLASPTFTGTVEIPNLTISSAQGTDGQVLTSTGSGIAWEDAAGGVDGIVSSADATAITIDSSENVGIGGSPDTQLNIKNADDAVVRIESIGSESGDDARLELKTTNGTFTIQNDRSLGTSGALTFAGNTSNNIVIDHNSGKVAIGTNAPDHDLHIESTNPTLMLAQSGSLNNSNSGRILFAESPSYTTNNSHFEIKYDGLENHLYFGSPIDGSTDLFVVGRDGNVGIGTTSPSEALSVSGNLEIIRTAPHLDLMEDGVTDSNHRFRQNAGNLYIQKLSDDKGTSTDRIVLDGGTGKVGIGTSPSEMLHILGGGSGPEIRLQNSASSHYIRAYDNNWNFLANATNTAMTIRNDGQVEFGGMVQISQGLSHNSTNACHYFGSTTGFTGVNPAIGRSGGTNFHISGSTTGDLCIGGEAGNSLIFGTSTSGGPGEAMRIDSSRSLFINTTSGYGTPGYSNMWIQHSTGRQRGIAFKATSTSSTDTPLQFFNGGAGIAGQVTYTYSATTYSTSSDYRLKENVVYDWDATTRLKQLRPCRFNWIADETNTPIDGFIAHEAAEVVPNSVVGEKDATKDAFLDADGNEIPGSTIDAQTMDHAKLVPLLVKTIQELEERITALEG